MRKRGRGRPPKNPTERKSGVVGVRLTPATVDRLNTAAKRRERTLSKEIEDRLEESFERYDNTVHVFGSKRNFHVLRLLAFALEWLSKETGQQWHRDPFTFTHAKIALAELFERFRPPGPLALPAAERERLSKLFADMDEDEMLSASDLGRQTAMDVIWLMLGQPETGEVHELREALRRAKVEIGALAARNEPRWKGAIMEGARKKSEKGGR